MNAGIFDDAPVLYESLRFQRAGFHDPRHSAATAFEGAPNWGNNAAWEGLLDGRSNQLSPSSGRV